MQASIQIDYNAQGYLLIPAHVARRYFPNDVLVLMVKGDELWMLPTRGAAAGGLLLKQRNPAGDRSVLGRPYLPDDASPGAWPAFWDERAGALRAAFRMPVRETRLQPAIAAKAVVEQEQGRWVVYLDLGFSAQGTDEFRIERHRIADYSSPERAKVAASWIERTADRDLKGQKFGGLTQ